MQQTAVITITFLHNVQWNMTCTRVPLAASVNACVATLPPSPNLRRRAQAPPRHPRAHAAHCAARRTTVCCATRGDVSTIDMDAVRNMLQSLPSSGPDDSSADSIADSDVDNDETFQSPSIELDAWSSDAGWEERSRPDPARAVAATAAATSAHGTDDDLLSGGGGVWRADDPDEGGPRFGGATPRPRSRRRMGPSASAWIRRTHELQLGYCKPKVVTSILLSLLGTDTSSIAASVREVTPLLDALMAHATLHCGALRSRQLDILGEVLERHAPLRAAVDADARLAGRLDLFLASAATEPATYDSPFAFSHMCTAQRRLRRCSRAFWDGLPACDLSAVDPRATATAVHSAAELARVHGHEPPSDDAMATMLELAAARADGMTATELTLTLWGLAKLGAEPAGKTAGRLRAALVAAAPRCGPRQAATAMWALANLRLHFHGRLRDALQAVLVDTAPRMNEQDVVNTLYGLAVLRAPMDGPLRDAFTPAAERLVQFMRPSEVHDTLVSLARLGCKVSPRARDAVAEAALGARESLDDKRRARIVLACRQLDVEKDPTPQQAAARQDLAEGKAVKAHMFASGQFAVASRP